MSHRTTPDDEPLRKIAARRTVRWASREAGSPPFGRLLVLQAGAAAGDALVALALAGSLFFSVPEPAARARVVAYLLLTLAPLAIVGPLLARLLDRHRAGLRTALVISTAGRALLAWLLAPRLETAWLFPLAFGVLVLSRAALIARGAILPAAVPEGRSFVSANSSLAKMSALAGMVAIPWGLALVYTFGSGAELRLAAAIYLAAALPALRLPAGRGARDPGLWMQARRGARPVTVRRSVVATSGMRFLVGFLAFHLAFSLRRESLGTIGLGLLIGSAALGSLLGGVLSGRLTRGGLGRTADARGGLGRTADARGGLGRTADARGGLGRTADGGRGSMKEEGIIASSLALASAAGIGVGLWFSLPLAAALTFAFGVASGAAKVAFDSLVQGLTPEAARGWVFARFEVVLQLCWVAGALVPVAVALPLASGITATGAAAAVLTVVYVAGYARRRAGG